MFVSSILEYITYCLIIAIGLTVVAKIGNYYFSYKDKEIATNVESVDTKKNNILLENCVITKYDTVLKTAELKCE